MVFQTPKSNLTQINEWLLKFFLKKDTKNSDLFYNNFFSIWSENDLKISDQIRSCLGNAIWSDLKSLFYQMILIWSEITIFAILPNSEFREAERNTVWHSCGFKGSKVNSFFKIFSNGGAADIEALSSGEN